MNQNKQNLNSTMIRNQQSLHDNNFNELFYQRHKYIFYSFSKMKSHKKNKSELVCYDKQNQQKILINKSILNIRKQNSINKFINTYKKVNQHQLNQKPSQMHQQSKQLITLKKKPHSKLNNIIDNKIDQIQQNKKQNNEIIFKHNNDNNKNENTITNFQIKKINYQIQNNNKPKKAVNSKQRNSKNNMNMNNRTLMCKTAQSIMNRNMKYKSNNNNSFYEKNKHKLKEIIKINSLHNNNNDNNNEISKNISLSFHNDNKDKDEQRRVKKPISSLHRKIPYQKDRRYFQRQNKVVTQNQKIISKYNKVNKFNVNDFVRINFNKQNDKNNTIISQKKNKQNIENKINKQKIFSKYNQKQTIQLIRPLIMTQKKKYSPNLSLDDYPVKINTIRKQHSQQKQEKRIKVPNIIKSNSVNQNQNFKKQADRLNFQTVDQKDSNFFITTNFENKQDNNQNKQKVSNHNQKCSQKHKKTIQSQNQKLESDFFNNNLSVNTMKTIPLIFSSQQLKFGQATETEKRSSIQRFIHIKVEIPYNNNQKNIYPNFNKKHQQQQKQQQNQQILNFSTKSLKSILKVKLKDNQILSRFHINQDDIEIKSQFNSYTSIKSKNQIDQKNINKYNKQEQYQFVKNIQFDQNYVDQRNNVKSKCKIKRTCGHQQIKNNMPFIRENHKKVSFPQMENKKSNSQQESKQVNKSNIKSITKYLGKQYYKQLIQQLKPQKSLIQSNHYDKQFTHNQISIPNYSGQQIQWKRYTPDQQQLQSFIYPSLLNKISDCFMISSSLVFARLYNCIMSIKPQILYRLIQYQPNNKNMFTVWLFVNNRFQPVIVDNYLPYCCVDKQQKQSCEYKQLYECKSNSIFEYHSILIKAISKVMNGYQKFTQLSLQQCFKLLTGRTIIPLPYALKSLFTQWSLQHYSINFNSFLLNQIKKYKSYIIIKNKRNGEIYFIKKVKQNGIKLLRCSPELKKYQLTWENLLKTQNVEIIMLPLENGYCNTIKYQSQNIIKDKKNSNSNSKGNIVCFKLKILQNKTNLVLYTQDLSKQSQQNTQNHQKKRIIIYQKVQQSENQHQNHQQKQMVLKYFTQKTQLQIYEIKKGQYRIYIETGNIRLKDYFQLPEKSQKQIYVEKDNKSIKNIKESQNVELLQQKKKHIITIVSDNKIQLKKIKDKIQQQ